MLIQNKQVAIVGGGPGGLTLARLLQLKGANVKLYERDFDKDARVQGSPLDMHENSGWVALNKADLTEEFKKNVRQGADKKIIVNERAEVIFSDHETDFYGNSDNEPLNGKGLSNESLRYKDLEDEPARYTDLSGESPRPEIDRGALRKVFLDSLHPDTVRWNSHFVSMEKQNEGWLLHFKNGSSAYADIVIAADGANSKIRPYLTDIKAFYSGFTMVEINIEQAEKAIPSIYRLLNGGKIMAFGDGKCLLGGQKGNGGLGFYASFKPGEHWISDSGLDFSDRAQLLAWFKKEYTQWGNIWYKLFENMTLPVIPRPIYCMPVDQTWAALPNLTLLGDAAHVMPPFAGEGANTSMFDAVELSECLTSDQYTSLQEAISAYETGMRKRAGAAAKQSLENGERMHSEGALEKMLTVFGIK